jgi:hypothetical protein
MDEETKGQKQPEGAKRAPQKRNSTQAGSQNQSHGGEQLLHRHTLGSSRGGVIKAQYSEGRMDLTLQMNYLRPGSGDLRNLSCGLENSLLWEF